MKFVSSVDGASTVCCQLRSSSTRPGHPSVGRRNEYQPMGGDAVRLESKGRYGSCLVAGKTVYLVHLSYSYTLKRVGVTHVNTCHTVCAAKVAKQQTRAE